MPDDLQAHFMQLFVAFTDCSAYVHHGLDHHGKCRIAVLDQLAYPRFVSSAADCSDRTLSVPRIWFSRSISLRLRRFLSARSERIFCISIFLTWDGAIPAQPHHLRDAACIVAVGLVAIVDSETRIWRASVPLDHHCQARARISAEARQQQSQDQPARSTEKVYGPQQR
ncbi:hypothetical protein [Bradyrhizobium tropiciagri]|uniref:hypothetical protein n=1 Tax=Bradyrhizobium tropiciagri TaxID=312253 RepID=UPI001009A773|nr:hypothetical protein [Bradyrhizobium tropiciagri]